MTQPISPAVGDRGEPFELVVEPGKIREFARATKARDPNWFGADAISPPTFLTTDRFWGGPDSHVLERGAIAGCASCTARRSTPSTGGRRLPARR